MQPSSPRVLHVLGSLPADGMELATIALIERTRQNFDYTVLCLRELGACAERLQRGGVPVHCLHQEDRHEWGLVWRIFRFLRGRRFDVVHTHNWGTVDALPAATFAGVPVRIHGEHGDGLVERGVVARRRFRMRRWLAPLVTRFVAVSGHMSRWLSAEIGIPEEKITVVTNGVDVQRFRPTPERNRVRAQLGYHADELLIGSTARLHAVKQQRILIEAFARLHESDRRLRVVLVGDGAERAALEETARRRGVSAAVRLAGHQADVLPWLQAMDLFVLPSATEGTSNALLEAMATGVPVIASAVGGNPEVLGDGGAGLLVPSGDVAALADAISRCCSDAGTRLQMGDAARRRASAVYPIETTVRAYTELYEMALSRRPPT